MKKLLITGAAGNLGHILANYAEPNSALSLRLMFHNSPLNDELFSNHEVEKVQADLADPITLIPATKGVDVIVHFAGVLFKHHPEKFLKKTNAGYFSNLLDAAIQSKVKRVILISFPHVEGESSPEHPASGRLDAVPTSVHAKTRLVEEQMLFEKAKEHGFEGVSLRVGMVYGKGILMIEGARWFAKHRLLGIWRKPTCIHLIATEDFLEATLQAIVRENIKGIYHLGDEGKLSLQDFLDQACTHWGYRKPVRMPVWMIMLAAWHFEMFSMIFNTRSPLTRDFIKIGMASYYGDTSRMRAELLGKLKYADLSAGIGTL